MSFSVPAEDDLITKRAKRLEEFKDWLQNFQEHAQAKYNIAIEYRDNAAETLNNSYWNCIENTIRPSLIRSGPVTRVDRHKIASATEMTIMRELPIVPPEDKSLHLFRNAQLAITVAKQVLIQWDDQGRIDGDCLMRLTPSFNREHCAWLRIACREAYPVFSNAGTWYAMEELCFAYTCNLRGFPLPGTTNTPVRPVKGTCPACKCAIP